MGNTPDAKIFRTKNLSSDSLRQAKNLRTKIFVAPREEV